MRLKTFLLVTLLVSIALPEAIAQIPWEISDQRCGNKVLDQFELCEKNVSESHCPTLGTLLKVATACDYAHCTCVPRVNKAFCGNNKREGVEVCDGTGPDKCPEYGALINLSLVCNPKTCGCKLNESIPEDYNPLVIETLTNNSQKTAVCGDRKVERGEDCDPPNTLCTTNTREPGVCSKTCSCLLPDLLDSESRETPNTSNTTINNSPTTEFSTNENITNTTSEQTEPAPERGFFARILTWIAQLFS